MFTYFIPRTLVEEHDPLKQGLKLDDSCWRQTRVHVEEHDPLKQGLKQIREYDEPAINEQVEEHDPLKQGLKPIRYNGCHVCW